jgi:hypothetical protein
LLEVIWIHDLINVPEIIAPAKVLGLIWVVLDLILILGLVLGMNLDMLIEICYLVKTAVSNV